MAGIVCNQALQKLFEANKVIDKILNSKDFKDVERAIDAVLAVSGCPLSRKSISIIISACGKAYKLYNTHNGTKAQIPTSEKVEGTKKILKQAANDVVNEEVNNLVKFAKWAQGMLLK